MTKAQREEFSKELSELLGTLNHYESLKSTQPRTLEIIMNLRDKLEGLIRAGNIFHVLKTSKFRMSGERIRTSPTSSYWRTTVVEIPKENLI